MLYFLFENTNWILIYFQTCFSLLLLNRYVCNCYPDSDTWCSRRHHIMNMGRFKCPYFNWSTCLQTKFSEATQLTSTLLIIIDILLHNLAWNEQRWGNKIKLDQFVCKRKKDNKNLFYKLFQEQVLFQILFERTPKINLVWF